MREDVVAEPLDIQQPEGDEFAGVTSMVRPPAGPRGKVSLLPFHPLGLDVTEWLRSLADPWQSNCEFITFRDLVSCTKSDELCGGEVY